MATASFYDFLKPENHNKKAYICNGTSCLLRGRQKQLHSALLKKYTDNEIGEIRCLGHCHHGEAYIENDRVLDVSHCYSGANENADKISFYSLSAVSIFDNQYETIEACYQSVLLDRQLIKQQLNDSKLRGRGGAGFLFSTKLNACASAASEQKYIVCNADEGDPGAFSDRYLLEYKPHLVMAGMLAAAQACGADTGFIYVRAEYPVAQKKIQQAINEFEKTEIFQQTSFCFRLITGAGSYICGEETALLNSIEGLKPEVRTRPPYPAEAGLYSMPTLLSNVETFAAVPWILEHSGAEYAALGNKHSTGTKLVCLDHGFSHPGVYEVEMGYSLKQLVYEAAGGFSNNVKALQIGGPLGCIVPVEMISELTIDFESFDAQGLLLGHAGIIAIPETFPMIDFMRHLFEFMSQESCGKCLPCRLGTQKAYDMLSLAGDQSPVDIHGFNDLLQLLEDGSLCGLGSGLPLPVRNMMKYFNHELADYFSQGEEK